MPERGSAADQTERLQKRRDLVRSTAALLSSDLPLREIFARFASLLGAVVDVSGLNVAIAGDDCPRFEFVFGDSGESRSSMEVSIPFGGRTVGVLSVSSHTNDAYDDDDVATLENCAIYLGARIRDEEQREASESLKRDATTDALTGLANRRAFDDGLASEWRRCARTRASLALAMI